MSLETLEVDDFDPFAQPALECVIPTSEAQREVWLADKLSSQASMAYNESISLVLNGRLDANALQRALDSLVARHQSLRATVSPDGTELLIGLPEAVALGQADLRALDADARAARLAEAAGVAAETPFDLEQGPLFRATLHALSEAQHVLMMTAHHIVCDGWSWGVITEDLGALYAEALGDAPGPEAPEQYSDYVSWEAAEAASPTLAEHEAFWLSRFQGSLPVLDLPTDRPRAAVRSFPSRRIDRMLDAALIQEVRRIGAKAGASAFATLYASFAALIGRIAGQDDIVIGVPSAGQSASGMNGLVGHCVNLLPVRTAIDAKTPFAQFVHRCGTELLDAFDHQTMTYGSLLKKLPIVRDTSRLPLVSIMFNVDQAVASRSEAYPGLEVELHVNPRHFENFEFFVNASQVDGGLRLECQYNTDLFDAATIERWLAAYETLLRAAVARPEAALGSLSLLCAGDHAALQALQPAPTPYPAEDAMHSAFERHAASAGARAAVQCGDVALSYAELDARANRLARSLRARGAQRGERVGLCLARSADMLVALLAVLKSGATYVPLDPSFPSARLSYYAEDARLALLVTESAVDNAPTAWREDAAARLLVLDRDTDWLAQDPAPIAPDALSAQPEDAAYVIYTSGSTGKPKGVAVPHRAVVNFLQSMAREPGLKADDILAAVTTLSFDIAVLELLLPLSVGAQVLLVSRDTAMDGVLLGNLLSRSGATCLQATPAMWRLLLDTDWRGSGRFKALVGGEALPAELARTMMSRCAEVWNMYGPTETTVWSTVWKVDLAQMTERGMSIGRPIANTSVWILDEQGELCPVGVPGELCIGGEGVTLGYLDRADLTADRFIADRFTTGTTRTLYRTGDRGRWRNDGQLEHLGRLDFQVKVRGYRIELGEIEAVCTEAEGVAQTVVITREDTPGDVRLVAYLKLDAGATLDEAALKSHLRVKLPDYMVPQHLVVLDSIPLLPNGKIDRKALPAPQGPAIGTADRADAAARRLPSSAAERSVAAVMEEVLKLPGIGAEENFFSLGGHSLIAAQLAMKLGRTLGVNVPMRVVFESPTVEGLARWVEAQQGGGAEKAITIAHRADQRTAPLSLMQQRLWFLEALKPGTAANNEPSGHRLTGELDEAAFQRALDELIRRQSSLRTLIVMEGGEPYQAVVDDVPTPLFPAEDLSALPQEAREARVAERMRELSLVPLSLSEGPLFQAHLFRMGPQEHVFYFSAHHIIWDGWSFDLFYHDFNALYGAFREGKPSPLAPLPITYGDFSAWQRDWMKGEQLKEQVAHWKRRLEGHLEPLELPTDRPRPAEQSGEGDMLWLDLPRATTDAVRQLGQAHGGTAYMVLLAMFSALLYQHSGRKDLLVGTPVRGRNLPELEDVMGFFVNSLPLRIELRPEGTVSELLNDVRLTTMEAFRYPDVPFEHLVHELKVPRDESRFPIYQTMFSYQDGRGRPTRWGNLEHRTNFVRKGVSAWDVGLWFLEREEGARGALLYNTDIFDTSTMALYRERYLRLLDEAVRDPSQTVQQLVSAAAEQERVAAWNATQRDYDRSACVHQVIAARAALAGAAPALIIGEHSLSHAGLDARSNALAHALRARGVGRGQLVGLCVERSLDMVAAQLAILKSGAGYVPLDPAYPTDRLAHMVEDARLALVVTTADLLGGLPWSRERALLLDDDQASIAAQPGSPLAASEALDARSEDPAYVIYTSGSTGKPKGVVVPHRTVVNFLQSMAREPGLKASDRLLAVTTLSFDIAVLELLLPLTVGATVILASRDDAMDGVALRGLLERHEITLMQATPSTWRMLIDAGWQGHAGFKALIGGEGLPTDLARQLVERSGELWNMYGPTETTVWSTCWKVDDLAHGITIGRPIDNTVVRILDERLQPCPIGVPGELWIGGEGVATGYLFREELTAERFVADPFEPGARLYRTGDRGRWRTDGLLEHLGRLDFQVKVRGHRIELGEIEATLVTHPEVSRAVVIVREDQPGDQRLVAYLVCTQGLPSVTLLRDHLRGTLPDYMLPQHFVEMAQIPLLPNGKIDRSALPRPVLAETAGAAVAPDSLQTDTERQIAAIWTQLLGVPSPHREDNFFDLGGSSMLAMQAIARMEQATAKRIKVRSYIFETLAQIAAGYDATVAEVPAAQPERKGGLLGRFFSSMKRG